MLTESFDIRVGSMEDIKTRVKNWLASNDGKGYVLEIKEERHIILSKSKHDLKVLCCYPCIVMFLGTIVFMGSILSTYPFTYESVLESMMGLILFIGLVMVFFIGFYCLNPKKTVFDVRFTHDTPINVTISVTSRSHEDFRTDYEIFKSAIIRDDPLLL